MGSTSQIIRSAIAVINPTQSIGPELGLAGKRAKDGMERPANEARAAADANRKNAEDLVRQAETRRANEESAATATAEGQAARSRQRAKSAAGARATLATGPLGLTGQAEVARKTLLGQ